MIKEDLNSVLKYFWNISYARKETATQKGYVRIQTKINKKNIKLHRFILNLNGNEIVDHINQNILDNRKINLRIVDRSENSRNREAKKNGTSIYKGVFKKRNKWIAQIRINGKTTHLGTFETELEAGQAYNKKYIEIYKTSIGSNII